MRIQILSTEVVNKGKYNAVNVVFKDLDSGKVDAKDIPDFANKEVYNYLQSADKSKSYRVTREKDKTGKYWNWAAVTPDDGTTTTPPSTSGSPETTTFQRRGTTTGRDYETATERARRQELIVNQSSLSTAVEMGYTKPEEVIKVAEQLSNWVFKYRPLAGFGTMEDDPV